LQGTEKPLLKLPISNVILPTTNALRYVINAIVNVFVEKYCGRYRGLVGAQ